MAEHTKGPWTVFDTPQGIGVNATEADVAHCDGFHVGARSRAEELANARLIAAAPGMLAALKEAAVFCREHYAPGIQKEEAMMWKIIEALRAAEGKS